MNGKQRPAMRYTDILKTVSQYYSEKVTTHGPTAKGVDWNSPESQTLRFEQLLKVCDGAGPFSLNDYGCGYGALADYLAARGYTVSYYGFDISEPMLAEARTLHRDWAHCQFVSDSAGLSEADYTVASGIFNVKLGATEEVWRDYLLDTLDRINVLSAKGFAVNALTKYSDADRMRPDLYYADPLFLFDYCKIRYSKYVALLHDYPLYEFTLLIRK